MPAYTWKLSSRYTDSFACTEYRIKKDPTEEDSRESSMLFRLMRRASIQASHDRRNSAGRTTWGSVNCKGRRSDDDGNSTFWQGYQEPLSPTARIAISYPRYSISCDQSWGDYVHEEEQGASADASKLKVCTPHIIRTVY
ncbi:hypothetical protein T310_1205 [Rasamsonia emersonii CBS 393.64]|uniref:Uncharacterized protein n=1 Tax=Rasamsonia emersonii (strain ATCC 16479 / CBS 393.64 / IMI 116815) TaxID=1408163 RepID=A0A0F4Z326_RASE3|nr:hypothetical protein T310_1205 [Rasamsonia emersonii CBS 393.64]KKA24740.1 hypothetical protein T310_1205 [Rasamsonia emersonii CBS 393.64]